MPTAFRWYWESEQPLRFQDSWFKAMLDVPDLRSTQTLRLELETLDYKVDQFMPIVERLERLESREYATHVVDGKPVSTKFVLTGKPEVYDWSGPPDINGRHFNPYKGKSILNYHVVTLTWRLCFPEIQRAHVPILRRAERIGAPKAIAAPIAKTDDDYHEEPIPEKPGEPWYYTRPSRSKRRQRRGTSEIVSDEKGARQAWFFARGVRGYLQLAQKWQDDARLVVDRNRFRKETLVERNRDREEMATGERMRVEARWEKEGSLMRLE